MCRIAVGAVVLCLAAGISTAQDIELAPAEPAEAAAGPTIDPADLEAFLDGIIEARMKSFEVAGVTLSVVHGGEVILAKGYGLADVDNNVRVDPATTLFRPGSISKTFTWTAVMQLVEQRKIDLDSDVRTYLTDVEIPDTFPEPITMADLMAHAPGFEESALGHLFAHDPDNVTTLKDYLPQYQPERVRPPGEVSAYSNYGSALAGHIVAAVSGMPFEEYVERNIFEPLGMAHSTFREPWTNLELDPMPPELEAGRSKGYTRREGGYAEGDFEFIHQVAPAGALSTTATDMARWMLAHLGEGTYEGATILQAETARRMHQRHFGHDDNVNGIAHGFIEYRIDGHRGFGHGGGTSYFLSDMVMVPELDFGLFVSTNTDTGYDLLGGMGLLPSLVVARYFPSGEEEAGQAPPEDFVDRAERFEGTYMSNRHSYTQLEKLVYPFMATAEVRATDDGYLVVASQSGETRLVETAPLTFRAAERGARYVFEEDADGSITAFVSDTPVHRFDRIGLYDDSKTILLVAVAALLVCLGVLIAAWYRRRQPIDQSGGERFASLAIGLTAVVWLAFFVLLGMALAELAAGTAEVLFDEFPSGTMVSALVVALLGVAGTLLSVVLLIPVWRRRSWTLGRRLRHTLAVAVFVDLMLVLNNLNVIGFKY